MKAHRGILSHSSGSEDELGNDKEKDNLGELKSQLEHNLDSLFLKMQTSAKQEIVQQLNQIN